MIVCLLNICWCCCCPSSNGSNSPTATDEITKPILNLVDCFFAFLGVLFCNTSFAFSLNLTLSAPERIFLVDVQPELELLDEGDGDVEDEEGLLFEELFVRELLEVELNTGSISSGIVFI